MTKIIIIIIIDVVFLSHVCPAEAVGHTDNPLQWDADDCRERSLISKCSATGRRNCSVVRCMHYSSG